MAGSRLLSARMSWARAWLIVDHPIAPARILPSYVKGRLDVEHPKEEPYVVAPLDWSSPAG